MSFFTIDVNDTVRITKNCGHHLVGQKTQLRFLWLRFTRSSLLFRLCFNLWCIVMDPSFEHGYETVQKVLLIAVKHRQTLLRNGQSMRLFSIESICGTHLAPSILIPKYSCKMLIIRLVEMLAVSAIWCIVARRLSFYVFYRPFLAWLILDNLDAHLKKCFNKRV